MKGSQQGGVGCSMGPPFLLIEGEGSQQGKVGFTPLYPAVNPTPHCCQCRTDVKLKFLVGNNLQPPGPLSLLILPTSNGNGVSRLRNMCQLNIYTGCFFHWYPPNKLKFGKPRLGESTLT